MVSSLVPDYEVKLLLNTTEVLDSNNQLKDDVQSAFSIESSAKEMSIQFVDTTKRTIYIHGWSLRIRKTEGDKKFELTYKKRYPIIDGDFSTAESTANIDTALETAKQDGFASTAPYEAQIEVGYKKQTLSISHDENASDDGFKGTNLPFIDKSRQFLADNAPDIFKEWAASNLGTDQLTDCIIYGPVHAKRYKGKWDGAKISLEVWPIQKRQTDATLEPIVEASFKTDGLEEALKGHAKLEEFLQSKGWFLAENSLKTELIMERYGETEAHL